MAITLSEVQEIIRATYDAKDRQRGTAKTFMWFIEEVGELATSLQSGTPEETAAEFADVLAWLATMANGVGVDLTDAFMKKYGTGCPGCQQIPCICALAEKP